MNEYKQAAEQNLKVWARRMSVSSDKLPAMAKALHKSFPGSVLKGPLAIVASAYLMQEIPSLDDRRPMSLGIAHVMADHLRGEGSGNFRRELELICPAPVMENHGQHMVEVINHALSQRRAERDKPNLANKIINHVKGRG